MLKVSACDRRGRVAAAVARHAASAQAREEPREATARIVLDVPGMGKRWHRRADRVREPRQQDGLAVHVPGRRLITPEIWYAALEQVRTLAPPPRSALRTILDAIAAGQARLEIRLQAPR